MCVQTLYFTQVVYCLKNKAEESCFSVFSSNSIPKQSESSTSFYYYCCIESLPCPVRTRCDKATQTSSIRSNPSKMTNQNNTKANKMNKKQVKNELEESLRLRQGWGTADKRLQYKKWSAVKLQN